MGPESVEACCRAYVDCSTKTQKKMPTPVTKEKGTLPKLAYSSPKTTATRSPSVIEATSVPKNDKLPKMSSKEAPKRGLAAFMIQPKVKQTSLLGVKSRVNSVTPVASVESNVPKDDTVALDAVVDLSIPSESVPPAVTLETVSEPLPTSVACATVDSVQITEIPLTPHVDTPAEKIINGNGNVKLIYEQYDELFPIVNGSTTQENIDDVYCLSFVMPDCVIHLSTHNPTVKRELEVNGNLDLFAIENPIGTYCNLEADCTYYVYVEQKAEFLARDQERMRVRAMSMAGATIRQDSASRISKDDGRVIESCSCIYGNPCVDEYGCKDWGNRATIATANGWKGF